MIPGAKEPEPLDKSMYRSKKSCICKICGKIIGTGFFSKIIYQNELIPVLILLARLTKPTPQILYHIILVCGLCQVS